MKAVVALVGLPNVGKSTLFNRLTRTRDALVADQPGLTRDRNYGDGKVGEHPYIVVDTGGLGDATQGINGLMMNQAMVAIEEADAVLFLVDGRAGLSAGDKTIADRLRRTGKPLMLVINKAEGRDVDLVSSDFHELGYAHTVAISAAHGEGVSDMMAELFEHLLDIEDESEEEADGPRSIKIAISGRPNVGKSTLVNRILKEDRVLAFDRPGTTRDSIRIPFQRGRQNYVLIDTAGMRRRSRVSEAVEKFSSIKALQAISEADVAILVIDAHAGGISEQDTKILGYVLESGKALVIAINKWDGMDEYDQQRVKDELQRRLAFIDFAEIHFISALHGKGVNALFKAVQRAYHAAQQALSTPQLTRILAEAVAQHAPPGVHGRRIKLRYAHQGGHRPPLIIIHGNQTSSVPASYVRYLENTFRKVLKLEGTPIKIEFRTSDNPYKGRKNVLSDRQQDKRKRFKRFLGRRDKKR